MKRLIKLAFVATLAIGITSCGSTGEAENADHNEHADHEGHDHDAEAKEAAISGDFGIDAANSSVNWTGGVVKIGGEHMYSHTGTLNIEAGKVSLKNGALAAGKIIIDMKSMVPTDDNYGGEGHTAKDLVGHLSSADFFNVEEFPTASFEFRGVEGNPLLGRMNIRGVSNEETLENVTIENADGVVTIIGTMTIDRQKYDVAYDMGAEDKLISDDIDLKVVIVCQAAM